MNVNFKLIFIILLVFSSGCATIMSGSNQNISVKIIDSNSNNILEGVSCVAINEIGDSYVINGNPGFVKVPVGKGALIINCKKNGYKQLNAQVGNNFNKTSLANVIFWPGMLVDLGTGAYQKYPSHYVISMEKV